MKKNILTLFSILSLSVYAQVGIETEEPEAMLDVNGDLRVRTIESVESTDFVLSSDNQGFMRKLPVSGINSGVVNMESAQFVSGVGDISARTPVLDLWDEQETNGVESIKRYYFLGQNVSVTLPANVSVLGDKTARVITFIVVDNAAFGGGALSGYNIAFQTKLYQENVSSFNGTNGGVFLYDSFFGGSDLLSGSGTSASVTEDDTGFRRRINLSVENSIRDREINFYDFGGKWIMTVND